MGFINTITRNSVNQIKILLYFHLILNIVENITAEQPLLPKMSIETNKKENRLKLKDFYRQYFKNSDTEFRNSGRSWGNQDDSFICDDELMREEEQKILVNIFLAEEFLESGHDSFKKQEYLIAGCNYRRSAKHFELAQMPDKADQSYIKSGNSFIFDYKECLNNNQLGNAASSAFHVAKVFEKAQIYQSAHYFCLQALTLFVKTKNLKRVSEAKIFANKLCLKLIGNQKIATNSTSELMDEETHITQAKELISKGNEVLERNNFFAAAVYFRFAAWHYQDAKKLELAKPIFILAAESFEKCAQQSHDTQDYASAGQNYKDCAEMYKCGENIELFKNMLALAAEAYKKGNLNNLASACEAMIFKSN